MRIAACRIAMVLAAGRGERMRPLSDCLPKPALPLPDGPVIASALHLAAATGVARIVVNGWHLADRLAQALDGLETTGPSVRMTREAVLMGTAGGLAAARDAGLLEGDGALLVINGDSVLDLDLGPVLDRHRDSSDLVTLALLPHPDPTRWSRVIADESGRVRRILPAGRPGAGEHPLVYPGVMVVARAALDGLPARPGEVAQELWAPALRAGRLGGAVTSGAWREVGTPVAYLEAVLGRLGRVAAVDATARVHPASRLRRALVGRDARVGAGAVVAESVVAEGAVVEENARVTRSVLLGAVQAGPEEVVDDDYRAAPR